MKLLRTIREVDIFPESGSDIQEDKYKERSSARAIVFDKERKVALLNVSKHNYYKLPGGGIEEGENIEEALKRECLEEIGCNIQIRDEVGEIIEYRNQVLRKQISYCFVAEVEGVKGDPKFEPDEIEKGFQNVWVTLDEAVELLKQSKTTAYNGNFIIVRDLVFLEAYKSLRDSDK
ncbi:MAG: NUDIX domain-containing protein [Candidatus Taylorbacteria bacterium]|nr:NUDIX domain-containing protein [Candidatus Taylorbacteria bacterium]